MQTTTDSEQVVEDDAVKDNPDYSAGVDKDESRDENIDNGGENGQDDMVIPQRAEEISDESNTAASDPTAFLKREDTFAVEQNGAASESDGEHSPPAKGDSDDDCRAEPKSAHVFEEVVNSAIEAREYSRSGRLVPQPPVVQVSRRDSAAWRQYEGREINWKMKLDALQKKVDEQQNDLTSQSQLISTFRKTQIKLAMTEEELNQTRLRCKQLNENLMALRKVNSLQSFDLDRQRQKQNRQAEVITKLKNAIDVSKHFLIPNWVLYNVGMV